MIETFNVDTIRADFPILEKLVRGEVPLTYLDSAATSQKPNAVINAVSDFYRFENGTIHRSGHELGELASQAYEVAREKMASFVGISAGNLIFTKNATESLNTIAYAFLNASLLKFAGDHKYTKYSLNPGDEILLTQMEHHANLVPWQNLAKSTGAVLKFLEVTEDGRLVLDPQKFSVKTKIVSITHQSNVLGTVLPIVEIVELAKKSGAVVVLDACQSVPHMPVDFENLGVSAAAWSGHKMVGPTGVGCLYLNDDLLEELPPFLMGGNMIETVQFETSTFKSGSYKFEAGTMNVAQAVGLGAAADYLKKLGMDNVHKYEQSLTSKALFGLLEVPGITVLGPKDMKDRGGVVSFVVDQVHPHDVSQYLDSKGIAIRAGHHCAWPLHRLLGAQASSRASFYLYNTRLEVDYFLEAVAEIRQYFKVA